MTCFAKIFLELVAWTPCRTKRTAAIEIVGAALARIATTPRQPGGDLGGGELGERASRLGWDAEWWRDGSRGWTRDRALAKPRRKCRNAGGTSGENVTAGRAARYPAIVWLWREVPNPNYELAPDGHPTAMSSEPTGAITRLKVRFVADDPESAATGRDRLP